MRKRKEPIGLLGMCLGQFSVYVYYLLGWGGWESKTLLHLRCLLDILVDMFSSGLDIQVWKSGGNLEVRYMNLKVISI